MTEVIEQSGIIRDLDIADYHAHPAISNSGLGLIEKAPRYYQHAMEEKDDDNKRHFVVGGALHTLLLERNLFIDRYHALPETYVDDKGEVKTFRADPRMKVYKEEIAKAGERKVLTSAEFSEVLAYADAVINDRAALEYISKPGIIEASIFWRDEDHDVDCRCRPDLIIQEDDGDILVDFKTTANASKDAFEGSIYAYGYDRQAYFYIKGYEYVTKRKVKKFVFIAVEKKAPYLTGVYPIDQVALMSGQMRTEHLLGVYADCKKRNFWPGLNEGKEVEASIPGWAAYKMEMEGVENIKPSVPDDVFLAC